MEHHVKGNHARKSFPINSEMEERQAAELNPSYVNCFGMMNP